jgi:uncharacterized membrane protein
MATAASRQHDLTQPKPVAFTPEDLHRAVTQKRAPIPSVARKNVGDAERAVSAVAGAILGAVGVYRKDVPGLVLATLGGALLIRGVSGHCSAYSAVGVDTSKREPTQRRKQSDPRGNDVEVAVSFLIGKSASELYAVWRDFERLPEFMTHLKSVKKIDARRTHWRASAPWLYGGEVAWDAEIVEDELNRRIAWHSEADADVEHAGSVEFKEAPGGRGTFVSIRLSYRPPGGRLGKWTARLFGEEPEQQIRADMRNFKRLMEVGELPTIDGQPRGSCR